MAGDLDLWLLELDGPERMTPAVGSGEEVRRIRIGVVGDKGEDERGRGHLGPGGDGVRGEGCGVEGGGV